jgi:hypothetical protein
MPSRTMFVNKHRPKGFEFPICKACNNVSRESEAVVAFFALAQFDLQPDSARQGQLTSLIARFHSRLPNLVEEVLLGRCGNLIREKRLRKETGIDFRLTELGPLAKSHLYLFAAKMAMAAYYEHTKVALPITGGVDSNIHTMMDVLENTLPKFPNFFGEFRTLRQGAWEVSEQFSYRFSIAEDSAAAVFQFVFHNNFIITSTVLKDRQLTDDPSFKWIFPGALMSVGDEPPNELVRYTYRATLTK